MIRVRFAPSPTGFLHIGGARTALFNWMYARSQGGVFVLRIEDTDMVRSKQEFLDEIMDSMKWLGLSWDELYKQSDRFDLYREYAKKLLDEGKAYKEGQAIILKMVRDQEVKLYDIIRGEITFDTNEIKDQVLIKSDGSPAYSFCCVLDDALMEISHVIRGEDHISNTPKQIVMYEALGFKPPKFAHLPLINAEGGGKMSKRTGAVAVTDYRKAGFLPQALVNYLMLLGWAPGPNEEIIGLEQAVKKFSVKKINKAAAAFSMDKLRWINSQYIRQATVEEIKALLIPFLQNAGLITEQYDDAYVTEAVELYKGRMSTLMDFVEWAAFLFSEHVTFDPHAKEQHLGKDHTNAFQTLCKKLEAVDEFSAENAEAAFKEATTSLDIKPGELVHPVRVALTGLAIGPSLFHIMSLLGKQRTIKRLKDAL